jgi:FtsZ-binding cell division protein ZapB
VTVVVQMTTFGTTDDKGREGLSTGSASRSEESGSMLGLLDTLSEKVEMTRATIVKLREDNEELRARCDDLREQLGRYESAGSPDQIERARSEIERLTRERDSLLAEREGVAERVRGILGKVEALEGLI